LVIGNRNDLDAFTDGARKSAATMLEELVAAAAAGATIHSNSFHAEPQGPNQPATYDITSADIDAFTWHHEDQIVFGSASNTNETQGPPGTAKNTVCVAAARRDLVNPSHGDGAPGPTADGRRKPDLMIVGCGVRSAQLGASIRTAPCRTVEKACASSHATPLAAAAAAVIRQYFQEGFHPSGTRRASDARTPSGALLKATLVHGTRLISSGPDDLGGWGVVDLAAALGFAGARGPTIIEDVRKAAGLITGEIRERVIAVDEAKATLRATLVWTDPPGAVGAATSLVNDLDLEVVAPDGTLFLGNVYEGGRSVPGGAADRINDVEMVSIERPALGSWTVRVRATHIPVGDPGQGYALIISCR
jgi:hypothetical protein